MEVCTERGTQIANLSGQRVFQNTISGKSLAFLIYSVVHYVELRNLPSSNSISLETEDVYCI